MECCPAGLDTPPLTRGMGVSMHDAESWRRRAAEMRTIADGLTALPGAKAVIMRTADEYDRRALRAERLRSR